MPLNHYKDYIHSTTVYNIKYNSNDEVSGITQEKKKKEPQNKCKINANAMAVPLLLT